MRRRSSDPSRPGRVFPAGERGPAPSPGRLESLFREYAPKVYRLALRCGLEPSEAEDGVQEVFLKVQRRIDTFRGEAALGTWLYQVALNTLRDHRRRVQRLTRAGSLSALGENAEEFLVREGAPAPAEEASRAERAQLVRRAIDRLPEKFREVLVLRELESLAYRDIARILELAQGTVESRIFRARERLARELSRLEESL